MIEQDKQAFGASGFVYTDDTNPVTGEFTVIDILEDTVFSAITAPNASGTALTSRSWKRGDKIYTKVTAYTLTSGEVAAYRSTR